MSAEELLQRCRRARTTAGCSVDHAGAARRRQPPSRCTEATKIDPWFVDRSPVLLTEVAGQVETAPELTLAQALRTAQAARPSPTPRSPPCGT